MSLGWYEYPWEFNDGAPVLFLLFIVAASSLICVFGGHQNRVIVIQPSDVRHGWKDIAIRVPAQSAQPAVPTVEAKAML